MAWRKPEVCWRDLFRFQTHKNYNLFREICSSISIVLHMSGQLFLFFTGLSRTQIHLLPNFWAKVSLNLRHYILCGVVFILFHGFKNHVGNPFCNNEFSLCCISWRTCLVGYPLNNLERTTCVSLCITWIGTYLFLAVYLHSVHRLQWVFVLFCCTGLELIP